MVGHDLHQRNIRGSRTLNSVKAICDLKYGTLSRKKDTKIDFSDVSKNSWELRVSAEIFLEIPDVASCAALLVCLSKPLALLKISSRSKTGVASGPVGFSLVLYLLEATLFQWSF